MKRIITTFLLAFLVFNAWAVRLIVLADVHVTPGNECEKQLKLAVQEINGTDCDAVIMCGDLTN